MSPERTVVWESYKFDGAPHRSAQAVDLGLTAQGRWLLVRRGAAVHRPGGRDYDHPCDAVTLVPTEGMWTAAWLRGWDPSLYVDVARVMRSEPGLIVTVDLDLDVVRHRDGTVETLDADELELHRWQFRYPDPLVTAITTTAAELATALRCEDVPFSTTPRTPVPPVQRMR